MPLPSRATEASVAPPAALWCRRAARKRPSPKRVLVRRRVAMNPRCARCALRRTTVVFNASGRIAIGQQDPAKGIAPEGIPPGPRSPYQAMRPHRRHHVPTLASSQAGMRASFHTLRPTSGPWCVLRVGLPFSRPPLPHSSGHPKLQGTAPCGARRPTNVESRCTMQETGRLQRQGLDLVLPPSPGRPKRSPGIVGGPSLHGGPQDSSGANSWRCTSVIPGRRSS